MPAQPGATERVSLRTTDSKTYANPDGTKTVEFGLDMHRNDGSGDLIPVDLNFVQVSTTEWRADRSRHIVRAYRESGVNWVEITHRASGKGIRYQIPLSATVQSNYAQFTGFGLTWRYYLSRRGVKLESSPVAASLGPKSYSFQVQLVGGATLSQVANATGGLDSENFLMPRPVAHCADGVDRSLSAWTRSGGTVTFSIDDTTFPPGAYPYTVDPTTVFSVTSGNDDAINTAYGSSWTPTSQGYWFVDDVVLARVEYDPAATGAEFRVDNILLRFDTSALPENASITGATLRVYVGACSSAESRSLRGDYYDWGSSAASDMVYDGDTISGLITPVALSAIPANAYYTFTLLNAAANISKSGTTEMRLVLSGAAPGTGGPTANYMFISTFESATFDEPRLSVDYEDPIGQVYALSW